LYADELYCKIYKNQQWLYGAIDRMTRSDKRRQRYWRLPTDASGRALWNDFGVSSIQTSRIKAEIL